MTKTIDRRAVLAGAAAIPAASVPAIALATETDPIIAALNAYLPLKAESNAAWNAYCGASDAIAPRPVWRDDFTEAEKVHWREEVERRCRLTRAAPHMRALEARADDTSDRASEAAKVVFETMPTTTAGLLFLIKTLGSSQSEDRNDIVGDRWDEYLPRLAAAVESIERRAV